MKKLFLILLLLACIKSEAQIYVSAAGTVGFHRSKDWRTFSDSYLASLGTRVIDDDMKLGGCSGYTLGIDAIAPKTGYWDGFSGLYAGFRMSELRSRASAKLIDGTRQFEMRESSWYCPIGFGTSEDGGFFAGSLGFGLSTARLVSMFEYPNGVQSIGTERPLNGVYSGSSFLFVPGMMVGFGGGKNDNGLKLYLTAEVNYRFAFGNLPLEEKMLLNGAFVTGSGGSTTLPLNYGSTAPPPAGDDDNLVDAKLGGLTFSLGIKLSFF